MYKIIRFSSRLPKAGEGGHMLSKKRTTQTGLSLDEAQAHCQDPKSSSKVSGLRGGWDWFDGYQEQ